VSMMLGGLLETSFMSLRSMSWWVSSVWRTIEECFDEYPARRRVARGGSDVLAKGGFRVEPEKVLEIAKEKLKQLLQV